MSKAWNIVEGILFGLLVSGVMGAQTFASIRSDRIFVADSKKTMKYLKDGVIEGGDRAMTDVIVKNIRRGVTNPGYERVVIDLEANRAGGAPAAVDRPPYFQVAISAEEERVIFTIWGKPKIEFPLKKVAKDLEKSVIIHKVHFLPKIREDFWTFEMGLKKGTQLEVFELKNPSRLIVDIKR